MPSGEQVGSDGWEVEEGTVWYYPAMGLGNCGTVLDLSVAKQNEEQGRADAGQVEERIAWNYVAAGHDSLGTAEVPVAKLNGERVRSDVGQVEEGVAWRWEVSVVDHELAGELERGVFPCLSASLPAIRMHERTPDLGQGAAYIPSFCPAFEGPWPSQGR
jgi:hypothetical protein